MSLKNQYRLGTAVGTTLTDEAGASDGTLAGASLPTIVNTGIGGYQNFSGGNGVTPGNYNRVTFAAADFQYNYDDPFSIFVIYRLSSAGGVLQSVFSYFDQDSTTELLLIDIDASEQPQSLTRADNNLKRTTASAIGDALWHSSIMTNSIDDLIAYDDGISTALDVDEVQSSGDFHVASAEPALGVTNDSSSGSYARDFNGDIAILRNSDHKLSVAEVMELNRFYLLAH